MFAFQKNSRQIIIFWESSFPIFVNKSSCAHLKSYIKSTKYLDITNSWSSHGHAKITGQLQASWKANSKCFWLRSGVNISNVRNPWVLIDQLLGPTRFWFGGEGLEGKDADIRNFPFSGDWLTNGRRRIIWIISKLYMVDQNYCIIIIKLKS